MRQRTDYRYPILAESSIAMFCHSSLSGIVLRKDCGQAGMTTREGFENEMRIDNSSMGA